MLGLVGGSVVTLLVTAPLAAGVIDGPGHWVGGMRSDAGGLPLTGWSTTGGDLRVPHFVATHLLQALAAVGWLASRPSRRHGVLWVWAAAVATTALVAATFLQAVSGQPLWATTAFMP